MPYRLHIQDLDPPRREWLRQGENLVGSASSSDVVLDHPTISRSHAVFVVAGEVVQLADVGSVNGTFLGGTKLREITTINEGAEIVLGSVSTRLEFVASGDAKPASAVSMDSSPAEPSTTAGTVDNRTTTSSHPVQLFALRILPELIDAVEACSKPVILAQLLGKGVLDLFPLEGLEISRSNVVCFTAGAPDTTSEHKTASFEIERGPWALKLFGPRAQSLALARPLFESALVLLDMAETKQHRRVPKPKDSAARVGETETVVSLDAVMSRLLLDAEKIAKGDVSVLIQGESGTGKEVFARHIHSHSGRQPLIALNCAALPQDLLEAELFGIESGVATGVSARAGCFERANGGTLFLDEIGDMSQTVQAKVLRALETKEVVRLGGDRARPAAARILAASNKDLSTMVTNEEFRLDLYHRIADWEVTLPPLRDRVEDLPNLVSLFLHQESEARQTQLAGVSSDALAMLLSYSWPGNVRELQREIKRAVLLLSDSDLLSSDVLSPRVRGSATPTKLGLEERLQQAEARELRRALALHDGKAAAAAKELKVPVSSFYRKLKAHGLSSAGDQEEQESLPR